MTQQSGMGGQGNANQVVRDFCFAPGDYLAYLAQPLPPLQTAYLRQLAQIRAQSDLMKALAAARDRNTQTAADKPFRLSLDIMGMAVPSTIMCSVPQGSRRTELVST